MSNYVFDSTVRQNGCLEIRVTGEMDSARFVQDYRGLLERVDAPWERDRLVDLSDTSGVVLYRDLEQLAKYWEGLRHKMTRPLREALVTGNRLMIARLPMVNLLFANHELRSFDARTDAEGWLASRMEGRDT